MKNLLLTTIAAVVLVGCGPSVDIHQAAREGSIEAVQQHIAAGTDVSTKDGSGRTPLHNAALKGRKEIAKLLIAGGADVNAKDNLTSTPLHFAAFTGPSDDHLAGSIQHAELVSEASQQEPITKSITLINTTEISEHQLKRCNFGCIFDLQKTWVNGRK